MANPDFLPPAGVLTNCGPAFLVPLPSKEGPGGGFCGAVVCCMQDLRRDRYFLPVRPSPDPSLSGRGIRTTVRWVYGDTPQGAYDGWRGVPRLSFAQPCWGCRGCRGPGDAGGCRGTALTMWSKERVRRILKDTAEKTRLWHPIRVRRHAPPGPHRLSQLTRRRPPPIL